MNIKLKESPHQKVPLLIVYKCLGLSRCKQPHTHAHTLSNSGTVVSEVLLWRPRKIMTAPRAPKFVSFQFNVFEIL